MFEIWYDYVKPKCKQKAKLCYMAIGTVLVYIKTEDVDIAKHF